MGSRRAGGGEAWNQQKWFVKTCTVAMETSPRYSYPQTASQVSFFPPTSSPLLALFLSPLPSPRSLHPAPFTPLPPHPSSCLSNWKIHRCLQRLCQVKGGTYTTYNSLFAILVNEDELFGLILGMWYGNTSLISCTSKVLHLYCLGILVWRCH